MWSVAWVVRGTGRPIRSAKYDADIASFDQPGDQRYVALISPRKVVANG